MRFHSFLVLRLSPSGKKGTGTTVRWKMQTEDGSLFEEAIQWDHLFARSQTNSTKPFVRRRAEIESVTGYFHDFSTSGWAARAALSFFQSESLKISGLPLWDVIVNDCAASSTAIVRWPRPDLARHCSAAAPRRASACLRSSRVSLTLARVALAQLSWPHTTNTHFVTQQFRSHLHVCARAQCLSAGTERALL